MLAEKLNGYAVIGEPAAFIAEPGTQLDTWHETASERVAHYGPADDILTRERLEHAYGCRLREIDHGAGRSFVPDV